MLQYMSVSFNLIEVNYTGHCFCESITIKIVSTILFRRLGSCFIRVKKIAFIFIKRDCSLQDYCFLLLFFCSQTPELQPYCINHIALQLTFSNCIKTNHILLRQTCLNLFQLYYAYTSYYF